MIRCMIPAKINSLRIPEKNIKKFLGVPIIKRIIQEAVKSNCFADIDVFTNSEKVRECVGNIDSVNFVDEKYDLPPLRTLSDTVDDYIDTANLRIGKLAVILPTAVFIDSGTIKEICEYEGKLTTIIGKKIDKKALNCFVNGSRLTRKYKNKISQELPQPYIDAGQFYLIDIKEHLKTRLILSNKIKVHELDHDSIDIDTMEDWNHAEELKYAQEKFKEISKSFP